MQFSRTQLLFGQEAMEKLKGSRVAVFGIGGVGGYCVEALARSGVGTLDLIDDDTVNITNLNRQIIATHATLGMDNKVYGVWAVRGGGSLFGHAEAWCKHYGAPIESEPGCPYALTL